MILFILFGAHALSKLDNSIFQMISLHSSNVSVNFEKMAIKFPSYFTISPSCYHPKFEFHNLRAMKSFNSFLITKHFTKFDLSITNSQFSHYLSSVIYHNNDYQQITNNHFSDSSKAELFTLMQSFSNNNSPNISISYCLFQGITGNLYDSEISAALHFSTIYSGVIIITESQFIDCRSADLAISNKIGGALYISTSGNQPFTVELKNLLFQECNSFRGAAFTIRSERSINNTQIYCRNINISRCINLPPNSYFDYPRNIVDIQSCFVAQFANILFEDVKSSKFLMNVLSFSNCDGKVSSLQFQNIEYPMINNFEYQIIEVSQNDGLSHTLIFDGLGFQNILNATAIYLKNEAENNDLNVVIDNFYFPGSNYIHTDGVISTSISVTHTETEGMNIITPTATASESPTPSITETPTPTATESPEPTPSDSPMPSVTETPTQSPSDSPTPSVSESPTESPSESPTESPLPTPTESPLATPSQSPSASQSPAPTQGDFSFINISFLFSETTAFTDIFNPNINNRHVSSNPDVGLIVGCTVAGIVLIVAIILIILFCCVRKVPCCACCKCCEKTAFQPSDEDSKTELCFFDETLNQAH